MYQEHFGLRQRPYPSTPDPACYYPATCHERALARLLRGLEEGEGLLLLTGEAGTGKTLLCHCLLDRLGTAVETVFLTNCHFSSRAGFLQAILYDLSLPYQGLTEQELRLSLTDALLQSFAAGRRTILVLDEAQDLGPDLLEEVRLWGNLEARGAKALQVVLLGQPRLLETLAGPELAGLRQRLVIRAGLEALPLQEAADYLLHHLRIAGGRPEHLLSDDAAELLARRTGGVPRLLNQAGHEALVLAAEAGAAGVDVEAALEALNLLGLDDEGEAEDPLAPPELVTAATNHAPVEAKESAAETEPNPADQSQDAEYRLFISPLEAS
jgi:type II secretory pathway predicted ATPase ExeA